MMAPAADAPHHPAIRKLQLTDFRNHAHLAVEAPAGLVTVIGDNGIGKTNILEAISLLSPGRGMRRAQRAEMARKDGDGGYAVSALIDGPLGPVRIGVGGRPEEVSRLVSIDGIRQKSTDGLTDHLRLIWLTPSMDGLFTGPAADRRRFLDRLVLGIDPAHGRRVAAFEQALTTRNKLLEDLRTDAAWLDGVEAQIAELGVAMAAARREAVDCLTRLIGAGAAHADFPTAGVALEGDLEGALEATAAADLEDSYRRDLAASRSRDRAAGRTLIGPHRSDLLVTHLPKAMPAALSSTGEQKALLVGLVLAQARLVAELAGMTPILLLDEVAAHLDQRRREALFVILGGMGAQSFMTGTDAAPFSGLGPDAGHIRLENTAREL